MAGMLGEDRFPKAEGELNLVKGTKVYLRNLKFVTQFGTGPAFGVVLEDSNWPDLYVTIDLLDKEKVAEWWNKDVPKDVLKEFQRKRKLYLNRKKVARGPRV